ncbi:helix-turn-helix transcriptional regulator [Paremcibacter congregatus]|uniref:helix-turn-helix domain-containing protein n=1 Tax=Paremcibacter congregatus TaxID=2043170 RepID=UPI0030EDBF09|tara:strand:+ start:11085 stop:11327 length:243 start_codon:yes stop_codon:yes gene_type:complete
MTKSIFSDRYQHFRKLLVNARNKAGLSQTQLAEKINKRQTFISKYEIGERRIDVVELIEIAEALNIDPCEIIVKLKKVKA